MRIIQDSINLKGLLLQILGIMDGFMEEVVSNLRPEGQIREPGKGKEVE